MLPRNSKSAPLANISCHFPAQSNVMNLWFIMNIGLCDKNNSLCWRPYRVECTGSLPTSEVKRRRARLVLGWGTAWEDLRVLSAFRMHAASLNLLACILAIDHRRNQGEGIRGYRLPVKSLLCICSRLLQHCSPNGGSGK